MPSAKLNSGVAMPVLVLGVYRVEEMEQLPNETDYRSIGTAELYHNGETDHYPEWRAVTGRDRTFWVRGRFVSTVGINESLTRKHVRGQEDASRMAE